MLGAAVAWRQGQSYSEDLRSRVFSAVDGGMSARAAAALLRVSVSYIYKALIRRRRTGERSASSRRGHRPRKLTPAQEGALAVHIEAHPDLTLAALRTWLLAAHGVRLSNGAMWSAVARLGLSFKKRMARPVRKRHVRGDLTGLRQRIRSRSCRPGQDGGPRALVLIKTTASMRHFLNQVPERRFNRQAISLSPLADISGHQRRWDADSRSFLCRRGGSVADRGVISGPGPQHRPGDPG